jgi:hypothetical protein
LIGGRVHWNATGSNVKLFSTLEFEAHAVFEMGWKNTIVIWMRVSTAMMAQMNFRGES